MMVVSAPSFRHARRQALTLTPRVNGPECSGLKTETFPVWIELLHFITGFLGILRSYLSIGEDSGIISFKTAFDEFLSAVAVDTVLLRVHVKNIVKREGLVLSQNNLGLRRGHKRADVTSLYLFLCQLWTNPGKIESV